MDSAGVNKRPELMLGVWLRWNDPPDWNPALVTPGEIFFFGPAERAQELHVSVCPALRFEMRKGLLGNKPSNVEPFYVMVTTGTLRLRRSAETRVSEIENLRMV